MTLIKSLLLGSAAGIVAVASAQAADLPTKKGAPAAEYVKACSITVNGTPIVGFIMPGSDTCLKISGYVQQHLTVGNTYNRTQNGVGMFTRGNLAFDAASNTAYGPLYTHIDVNAQYGAGFDSATTNATNLDNAYIQWAGLTAGQHGSFFDFHGGIGAWDDLLTPDHTGTGTPLIAYTAAFGGGFSATLSVENPQSNSNIGTAAVAGGANQIPGFFNYSAQGTRAPDLVAALNLTQGWGALHLAGMAHSVNGIASTIGNASPFAAGTGAAGTSTVDKWGYALEAGVTFNIPGMAGGTLNGQVVYTKDASNYIGLGQVGVNTPTNMSAAWTTTPGDVSYNPTGTAVSDVTGWSTAEWAVLPFNANFSVQPEFSYAYASTTNWSESAIIAGATFDYSPVKNLDFAIDLLYEAGKVSSTPIAAAPNNVTSFNGFNAKLRIARSF